MTVTSLSKNTGHKFSGLCVLALLQIGDAWTTLSLPHNTELNSISGWLIDHGILIQAKLSLAAVFVLMALFGRFSKRAITLVWALVAFYSLVVTWNLFLVIRSH